MTGRDIIKFILRNNLLDKQFASSISTAPILRSIDYLPNDEEMKYSLYEDGRYRVSITDCLDNYILIDSKLSLSKMNDLKIIDTFVPSDDTLNRYNQYTDTFRQWLYGLTDQGSITHLIVDYANFDSNFGRNCSSYNKMMSYLESKDVDDDIILSAGVAWNQYMRECRKV